MNCENLFEKLGFECASLANGAIRLWSPFTFSDGEHLGVFLEPSGQDRWVVTDHADALMHASAMGAKLTNQRLDKLRHEFPGVLLTSGGALLANAEKADLPSTIASVLSVAIAISRTERKWIPDSDEIRFSNLVDRELQQVAGDRLQRKVAVRGASGHQIEIPFVVSLPSGERRYIQPVSSKDKRVDWANVYKAGGKMHDLPRDTSGENHGFVVIEDRPHDTELGKAVTYLSSTATVFRFSRRKQWLDRLLKAA